MPGKLELTIHLTRVVLPFLTMAAVAAATMGMLNSLHHYFLPGARAGDVQRGDRSSCALALVPLMPALGMPPIMAMAMAAILGGLVQVAMQWPSLRREGFRYAAGPRSATIRGLQRVLAAHGARHASASRRRKSTSSSTRCSRPVRALARFRGSRMRSG